MLANIAKIPATIPKSLIVRSMQSRRNQKWNALKKLQIFCELVYFALRRRPYSNAGWASFLYLRSASIFYERCGKYFLDFFKQREKLLFRADFQNYFSGAAAFPFLNPHRALLLCLLICRKRSVCALYPDFSLSHSKVLPDNYCLL